MDPTAKMATATSRSVSRGPQQRRLAARNNLTTGIPVPVAAISPDALARWPRHLRPWVLKALVDIERVTAPPAPGGTQ